MHITPDTRLTKDAGLWLSVTALAEMKGVKKQTISEKVSRLEREGRIAVRCEGKGKPKLVNVAAYDRAVGETTDLAREQGAATKKAELSTSDVDTQSKIYSAEQARHMALKADMAQLDYDERIGKLLPLDDVAQAMVRCAEALTRSIEQIVARADDLASAVARDGTAGARTFLKSTARDLRATLAQEMRLLEAEASASNDDLDEMDTKASLIDEDEA